MTGFSVQIFAGAEYFWTSGAFSGRSSACFSHYNLNLHIETYYFVSLQERRFLMNRKIRIFEPMLSSLKPFEV